MRAHINITGSSFLRAIGHHLLRFKILTLSCLPHSAEQGIMPIGGLIVNLLLKCLSLKELVSQEAYGEVGLGVWAKGLGWEDGFQEEQAEGGAWVGVKMRRGMKSQDHCNSTIPPRRYGHQGYRWLRLPVSTGWGWSRWPGHCCQLEPRKAMPTKLGHWRQIGYEEQTSECWRPPSHTEAAERCSGQGWLYLMPSVCLPDG